MGRLALRLVAARDAGQVRPMCLLPVAIRQSIPHSGVSIGGFGLHRLLGLLWQTLGSGEGVVR